MDKNTNNMEYSLFICISETLLVNLQYKIKRLKCNFSDYENKPIIISGHGTHAARLTHHSLRPQYGTKN